MTCHFIAWCALKPEEQAAWVQAIGTILGIAAAVAVGVVQWRSSMKIARASNSPLLTITADVQGGMDPPTCRLVLANRGNGPARITKFLVLLDGKEPTFAKNRYWMDLLGSLDWPVKHAGGIYFSLGEGFGAGHQVDIFGVQFESGHDDLVSVIHDQLARIGVFIDYASVYGDVNSVDFSEDDPPSSSQRSPRPLG